MAKHGVFAKEKLIKQQFKLDIVLHLNLSSAASSDDLHNTIDYGSVYEDVRLIVEEHSYNLIEKLAQTVADAILGKYPIDKVEIGVYKTEPLFFENLDYFAVFITRSRH